MSGAGGEAGAECAEAGVADFEADVRDGEILGREQALSGFHAAARDEVVRTFLEDAREKTLEVERGEAGFAGGTVEGHGVGDGRGEEIARAAEAAERDVVHQGHLR